MSQTLKAWHFVGDRLRDGTKIPADGKILKFNKTPILCEQGLHASIDAFDALTYAPGPTLCLVECGGEIIKSDDKLVCTERTIIARMDATEMLGYFARMQALSVIHLWDAPDVVLDYLMTADEGIRAAAGAAAWVAAWVAAGDAAWAAARAAARARAAALRRAAAWAAAGKDFNEIVKDCFSDYLYQRR